MQLVRELQQNSTKWSALYWGKCVHAHVCAVLRISYMHVHIFMWEGTEHSVFHIHGLQPCTVPVTTVHWCHYLALCSCVPSWCSELQICNVNHFCSEPSGKPKNRENGILSRNRTASYKLMGRHCTSSTMRHPAATQQSLGTEHLWTVWTRSDMRIVRMVRTGLLQPNAAGVCYWHTMTVTASVGEWLNCDQDWQCQVFCPPDMWLEVSTF